MCLWDEEKKKEKEMGDTFFQSTDATVEDGSSCNDGTFFRVLMPQWKTFCSPGRIAWEGDRHTHGQSDYYTEAAQ